MSDASSSSSNVTKRHTIEVAQQTVQYDPQDKTLLNSLEKANIEVHYHCRDGFCGACRVTLLTGKICYPNGEPLAFVGENEILPCCCIPVSDVSLSID
ncbi:class I ribonucleotide reductase maintenance protein YfaE [Thalassotalea sp. G2M2-11]|uniref:class I ribonucleotide reductase maintenance protein YfaE n=1 Tax=Thalassotalea sp. G2M2-11 TaxID=2787627 RepID=UPI0019D02C03|nr:class I ribonucleotide reductase maintenance protein YfaE [Thalassotalea sp. G2M2-11]